MSDRDMWEQRYGGPGYVYGTDPNDFLAQVAPRLHGPVLSLGEGQGRNAVFLASRGLDVTGIDLSEQGVLKARALASERGVTGATFQVADLATFELGRARWGTIYSIFCHLPRALRADVHRRVIEALAPGGRYVLEAYTPRQLAFATGGPRAVDMLVEPEDLRAEVRGLTIERLEELERDVNEGPLHSGRSAVVQLVALRPA